MRIAPLFTAAAALLLGACSSIDYYVVKSRYEASGQVQGDPEIIRTDAYRANVRPGLTVALRAPDTCANNTADRATGNAVSQSTVLATNCGVEMAEIERSLARRGYQVISWNIIQREMRGNKSVNEIATQLGADVIFQINSLERSSKNMGKDARWERSYFHSDAMATPRTPMPLDDRQRAFVRTQYLANAEKGFESRAGTLAVTLDATAIWVKNNQSIWYYRWTRAQEMGLGQNEITLHLVCRDSLYACQARVPASSGARAGTATAGESVGISESEKAADRERAIYAELLRGVIDNFVSAFAKTS